MSVRWLVEGAVRALLQCQDGLVILLECQEVNPEAVRHRLLLRVVLELAGFMKEHLTQRQCDRQSRKFVVYWVNLSANNANY